MVVAGLIWWRQVSYGGGRSHMVVAGLVWQVSYGGGRSRMVVAGLVWWRQGGRSRIHGGCVMVAG